MRIITHKKTKFTRRKSRRKRRPPVYYRKPKYEYSKIDCSNYRTKIDSANTGQRGVPFLTCDERWTQKKKQKGSCHPVSFVECCEHEAT